MDDASSQPVWIKSSSSLGNGNCAEVADLGNGSVGVRNSRDPFQTVVRFSQDEWHAFLAGARKGDFDGLGRKRAGSGPRGNSFANGPDPDGPRVSWEQRAFVNATRTSIWDYLEPGLPL